MWNTFRTILLSSPMLASKSNIKLPNYYSGPELPISDIQNHLAQFEGGSFDLSIDDNSGIATLCINHYEKRNAISGKMMVDLDKAVTRLESWQSGKGVLMYGSNNTFCSGGDLNFARKTSNPDDGFQMSCFMHSVLNRFEKLPFVTVALIEGSGALGGGAELAVACDFRLMMENAKGIGFVHSRMGIVPAWGGATRLVSLVGYRTALDLLTTARIADPKEALKIGLIDDIISSGDSVKAAVEWLSLRTQYAREVVQATKSIVCNARRMHHEDSLSEERRLFAPLWGGPANQQALMKNIRHKI
ncbi:ethylmalonyl-CoA decarboxylase [Anabrus simplex]|uniref:ethylmalonyl-CoA decarboxylase n=1 Tax=Anabrus simplex TaxID=316456 RepID=UPI0035A36144